MMTNGLWRFFGGTLVAASLVTACGSSGDDEELPGAGGSAGATAGKGGSAGSTGGAAGKGGTGGSTGGTAGTAGKGGSAGSTGGTGGTAGKGGTGGSTGGTGGTAGKGGTGGSTGGTGGTAGKGGTGGSTGGTGGTAGTAGKGGTGGSTAGSGGSTAGSGGSTAGSGGSTAGSGGSTAGSGGSTAGSGGSTGGAAGDAGAGGSAAGSAGAGGGDICPFPPCGSAGTGGSAGGGGSPSCDKTDPSVDADGDGYFPPADCNDCDPNTNPGALDIVNVDIGGNPLPVDQQVDEDCSGTATQATDPKTCDGDAGLVIDSASAVHGANAIDICQTSDGSAGSPWGIVKAEYVLMNGNAIPATVGYERGHGLLADWGTNVTPQLGSKMLAISSGNARDKNDPDFNNNNTVDRPGDPPVAANAPPGFPIGSPGCPQSGTLNDSMALKLTLKAPTNAKSLSFKFKFHTYEYAQYICSAYNDMFVATMRGNTCASDVDCSGGWVCSTNTNGAKNCIPNGADPATGNVSFDPGKNLISVNSLAFLNVCFPPGGTFGGKPFTCAEGSSELLGTGFEDGTYPAGTPSVSVTGHGATKWLQTTAPVVPGSTFTLTFAIADSADSALDSTVLIDDFEWSASPGTVNTGNACKLGGTGTCPACINGAVAVKGCCRDQFLACKSDQAPAGCDELLSCLSLCQEQTCRDACFASHPDGKAAYDTVLACFYGSGATDDYGACGKACQLVGNQPQQERAGRREPIGPSFFPRIDARPARPDLERRGAGTATARVGDARGPWWAWRRRSTVPTCSPPVPRTRPRDSHARAIARRQGVGPAGCLRASQQRTCARRRSRDPG